MVAINPTEQRLTLAQFLDCPETKPASEYFEGEITQKLMPQGEHSLIQTYLSAAINQGSQPNKKALALTELRCTFGGQSIVPDIAVFSWGRIPKTEKGTIANRFETYPDWIIEIISPEQSANKVIKKILFCLNSGTQLGWLVDPEDKSVMIFKPNQQPDIQSENDVLVVLEDIGDCRLTVNEMFSWLSVS